MRKKHEILSPEDEALALEREARKHVRELRSFYSHLVTYLMVNLMLVAINLLSSPGEFWAIWPIMGWGIGLASHAIQTFGIFGISSKQWEQRKIQEYVLQRRHGLSEGEVRKMLREELQDSKQALPTASDLNRMLQRLEHLEAIVTSEDWDRVRPSSVDPSGGRIELPREEESDVERAARLARRVR